MDHWFAENGFDPPKQSQDAFGLSQKRRSLLKNSERYVIGLHPVPKTAITGAQSGQPQRI
jgi:hypothetical protein